MGKSLAFLLSNSNIFEHRTVTLMGFSFGGVVAWNCFNDLFLLGRAEKMKDLILIGSPISQFDFDHQSINNINGNIFNVYSKTDAELKLVTDNMKNMKNCAGLGKL